MLPVLDGDRRPLGELEKGLVDEDGGGERIARPAPGALATGEPVQLAVDRGKGALQRRAIAFAERRAVG